ncbi:MAG: hypothetical protein AMS27_06375 [Bacteroides sp. SM23_62_1]|nr:MAG: hypothetical protein AMS27_06375 [Bacteroides sp. SM23_62_1]
MWNNPAGRISIHIHSMLPGVNAKSCFQPATFPATGCDWIVHLPGYSQDSLPDWNNGTGFSTGLILKTFGVAD